MQVMLEDMKVYVLIQIETSSDLPAENTVFSVHVNRASAVAHKNRLEVYMEEKRLANKVIHDALGSAGRAFLHKIFSYHVVERELSF